MKKTLFITLTLAAVAALHGCAGGNKTITLESLLDEMVSVEELARFPDPYYTSHQESSHDRRSLSPDEAGWFANNDGFGIVRTDTVNGRIEKVMFDQQGPGVITRIWITTLDKRGMWRFYFDGEDEPGWTIPAYDLMRMGIPQLGRGLLQPHTSYTPDGKGGNTLFLPIPYKKGCKITFEDEPGVEPTPKYYGINYRKYPEGTQVETFSAEVVQRAASAIARTDELLLNPVTSRGGQVLSNEGVIASDGSMEISLPEGENAVYKVTFAVSAAALPPVASDFGGDAAGSAAGSGEGAGKAAAAAGGADSYGQLMRSIVFCAEFDGKQTAWVPLGDFSGGGMGAPRVESWYLSADGKGGVTSRWLMPYQKGGKLKLLNISDAEVTARIEAEVAPLKWDERSLYFHASWRWETHIYTHNKPDEAENCIEWNFATIEGRGVYKGDLLSLFNHAPQWYGEGDEKIWVDGDTFPSHFGTGTEDYYNSSWAPVVPFHTPFGGAPRADLESSHGYNAFFRTRNLDGIPFKEKMVFDIEMIGWQRGYVDYAATTYWYGDYDSRAIGLSGEEEAGVELVAAPPNPADYHIEGSMEFETAVIVDKSPSLRFEKQSMAGFDGGKWSRASQALFTGGKEGDFVTFEFGGSESETDGGESGRLEDGRQYKLEACLTQANDYGILEFDVNGKPTGVSFDSYNKTVKTSGPLFLGTYTPAGGKIKVTVRLVGTNERSVGQRYMFGLDCLRFTPVTK